MSIGFGIIGTRMMESTSAEAMRTQAPSARLVAGVGGTRAAALGAEYEVPAEADAAALLARHDVDVVVIATPHTTHRPLAVAAAEAGKHVYLETPMALSVAECDDILEACERAGVLATVASQSRYNEISIRAKELIDQGTPDISVADGRAAIEMVEAAVRSARSGEAQSIPLADR